MIKVNVLLADGFEEIEALAVVDLLRRAQVYVGTVSVMDDYMVHGAHGISVQAEDLFDEVDFAETDALILPGGMPGTTNLKEHEGVRKVTAELAEKGKIIGAICAAPTVLSDLGLLKGKRVTCYPSVETDIQGAVIMKAPVVSDGNIITSRGAGTAIDFALELIAVLVGKERALSVAESIVYR
ncbi:MAG: DJ-1/PfpI family protein [Dorea sp.]|jgi:4-methyl-5(b-hydroxyethyl)-thiazole monophosphate biosynthesis|nr:DJ-1/PfpI family protein [Dorea sp.]MCI9248254.1 DJ-1/PfpI family protein [Dorea sp.]